MSYSSQKLAGDVGRYNIVTNTNNLEVSVRAMVTGVLADSRIGIDGKLKEWLFIGGKHKPRSPLRDLSVTQVTIPRDRNDDEVYIESIVNVVNRYLTNEKMAKNDNKIKAILIRLFSNNVVGFYDKFKLSKNYLDQINCVYSDLAIASSTCVERFREAIENQEYLSKKLPDRFEYKTPSPSGIYNEYLKDFDCDTQTLDKEALDKFMESVSQVHDDSDPDDGEDTENDPDVNLLENSLSSDDIIDMIPTIIERYGYSKVLSARSDKFIQSKFSKIKDSNKIIFNNLSKIIKGFHATYIRLTCSVWADTYKLMFHMAPSTYKENRAKVIKEIFDITNSDEYIEFKRLLLGQND